MLDPLVCSFSFGPPSEPLGKCRILPFQVGTQTPECFNKFPMVTQLASGETGMIIESFSSQVQPVRIFYVSGTPPSKEGICNDSGEGEDMRDPLLRALTSRPRRYLHLQEGLWN